MSGLLSAEEIEGVLKPLEEAWWLPGRIYKDPEVWEEEKRQIFRPGWMAIGTAAQIPDPGDYFAVRVLDEPLMVVRDEGGDVRCYYNVCMHRAMCLVQGTGHAKTFECPYHAWTYDTDGKLIGAPEMQKTAGFDRKNIRLTEIRVELWQGFVFINFDGTAAPLAPDLAGLAEEVKPWTIADLEVVYEHRYQGDWNWKTMWENGIENYHTLAIHRDSAHPVIPSHTTTSTDYETGAVTDLIIPFNTEVSFYGDADPPPAMPDLPGWTDKEMRFWMITPTLGLSAAPEGITSYNLIPNKHDQLDFVWRLHVPKSLKDWDGFEEYLRGQEEFADLIQSEDEQACMHAGRGMLSQGWKPCRYSHLEKPVWQFHQWYVRRMSENSGRRGKLKAVGL
ncbi:aromatic ring-hydroxylating dioxygenase subunit alpha [Sphingopyxis sp.]|uniref:aromatic ring-hydroxylating oxygenase subunit alpha n=1 Tax=Sphingopyxis sp. TaxID=1908224 RepID=UPI002DF68E71|nr:aromatic ring-hydroxylating dioxygenase subunit alpha [Sphingopyxis sp.]